MYKAILVGKRVWKLAKNKAKNQGPRTSCLHDSSLGNFKISKQFMKKNPERTENMQSMSDPGHIFVAILVYVLFDEPWTELMLTGTVQQHPRII